MSFPFPEVNASLNAAAAVCLAIGYICIKNKRIWAHRLAMVSALAFSAIFLGFYLVYHAQTGAQTPFAGQGYWRWIYYPLLISHILLAIIILPLIFKTLRLALAGHYAKHRQWAKWTYPLWVYVSITGVLVYFFLYQWFKPI